MSHLHRRNPGYEKTQASEGVSRWNAETPTWTSTAFWCRHHRRRIHLRACPTCDAAALKLARPNVALPTIAMTNWLLREDVWEWDVTSDSRP